MKNVLNDEVCDPDIYMYGTGATGDAMKNDSRAPNLYLYHLKMRQAKGGKVISFIGNPIITLANYHIITLAFSSSSSPPLQGSISR